VQWWRVMGWEHRKPHGSKANQPKLKRPPRLSMEEFRQFGRACKSMNALAAMLTASGWNGKPVALLELAQAYEPIAQIYNRVEASIHGWPWPPPEEKPQDASGEGGTGGSSGGSQSAAPAAAEV
jgi:hypothetical protein